MRRNKFSLSHYNLLTGDMGYLIPVTWFEALPGDSIQCASNLLLRITPQLAPVMHPVRVRIHWWSCPIRQIWDDWEDFRTGGEDGLNASTHPYISAASIAESGIHDYMGVPPDAAYSPNIEFSALPLRAYQHIFNNFYRDQQLVTEATIDTTDGQDTTTSTTLQSVCWEKDYFTTCRSDTDLGSTVTIPLLDKASVRTDASASNDLTIKTAASTWTKMDSDSTFVDLSATAGTQAKELYADLAAASGIDINEFRLAIATQKYQEARNIYGARYVEYLKYLGVNPTMGRIQEPEYLGGGRATVQFSEVLATADSGTYDVGDMLGHGVSAMRTPRWRRFFEEDCIVMGLLSVIPKTIYANGLHRSFSRTSKEDYFTKEFQNIGEQAVLNKEVYTAHTTPGGTFGYQARYDEYRSLPSSIHGEFHSTNDHWHFARIFSTDPSLNSTFVTASPTKRVLQSSGTDAMYMLANHSIQARRPITKRAPMSVF